MPLPAMQFQPENLGELYLKGLKTGSDVVQGGQSAQAQHLANAIKQMYGMPQAEADLNKSKLYNQYYGRDMESQIGMHDAMSGLYGEQAKMEAFKRNHPYMMANNQWQLMAALQDEMKNTGMPTQGGQGSQGGQNMPMGGMGNEIPNAPNIPGQESFSGWQPPQRQINPQQAALQQAMQQRTDGLQIPAGSMDVLKPQALAEALQQTQQAGQAQNQQPQPEQQSQGQQQNSPFPQTREGLMKLMQDQVMADMNYKKALVNSMEHKLNASGYKDLTPNEKGQTLAQMKGLGFTNDEAIKYLESDSRHTLRTAAAEKGYNPNRPETWPSEKFAPTTAVLSNIERSNVANAALQTISPFITKGIAPYAKRIEDVSPALIKDIIKDTNVDRASDALAAWALGKEAAGLRGRVGNLSVGINYLRDMTNASQSNLNTLKLTPGSAIYQETQKKIDRELNKMNMAENNAAFNMPSYRNAQRQDQNNDADRSIEDLEAELKNLGG